MKALQKTLIGIVLLAGPGFCGIGGFMPLGPLLNQADAVVVGTVVGSTTGAGRLSLNLTVLRTVKGSGELGSSILATWSSPGFSYTGLNTSVVQVSPLLRATGVWFLQQVGGGWAVLPLTGGTVLANDIYIPVPSGALPTAYAYQIGAAPQTKLLQEIGAAAEDPTTARAISRLEGSRILVGLDQTDLQGLLSHLASSSQTVAKATGLAGLLRLSIPSAATTLSAIDFSIFPNEVQNYLFNAICEYRSTDSGGVSALGILLNSRYQDSVRTCATHALREIHTLQAALLLEALFEDASPRIRYDAVIGIAQFAMGFPRASMADKIAVMASFKPGPSVTHEMKQHLPSQSLFSTNEQEYLSYWKMWLSAHSGQQ
jgi:hypothetical protein